MSIQREPVSHLSEVKTNAELDLAHRHSRSESQRLAGCQTRCAVHPERRSHYSWISDDIVNPRVICPVRYIKCLGDESQPSLLAKFKSMAQPQIERQIFGPKPAVAGSAGWPVIGEVVVAVDIGSSQQVEGMAAVVRNDRRKLEARQD